MGGGRTGSGRGGQSGFFSPPPAARRTTVQLGSAGGGRGRGLSALELLRTLGARPRSLGARGLSTLALAPREPMSSAGASQAATGLRPPIQRPLAGLGDKPGRLNARAMTEGCTLEPVSLKKRRRKKELERKKALQGHWDQERTHL